MYFSMVATEKFFRVRLSHQSPTPLNCCSGNCTRYEKYN
ncbi:hypothetical protein APHCR_0848 [Anaplasma phagocytophilum str. CR1007]|uniref:Uncharacterized protein n=1 Tax=Anaplasma phagocytophilum str. NCH-1 TaxID=1359161 RepID=A0A0F3NJQ1_ANAPH|nr:hypothetical protein APHWEB_0643 [Anaplasma phagocytophilum str. Webster]KJV68278.1 hypothetical protein EPHNCH_0081 [Anaplasma phagocytophilum str. NCH-1]KJZ99276.1 hypothetical protein APHCR_0848 [Anaplasma phagocytophilum str. CR1007]